MNKVPIPISFQLMGETIIVERRTNMIHETNCDGLACYNESTIRIQTNRSDGLSNESQYIEKVFFHELTHWILNQMAEHDLKKNEKFVETFSGLLHQALKTAEYKGG